MEDATWEKVSLVALQFIDFHLEDMGALWGAGSDRPQITRVYQHKRARKSEHYALVGGPIGNICQLCLGHGGKVEWVGYVEVSLGQLLACILC